MKLKILLIVCLTSFSIICQSQNSFENPHPLIEKLEFTFSEERPGMNLKLSLKGIKYCQKDLKNNSKVVAQLVKKLHNDMVGGSSKLKVDCIASQIYYHICFYDTSKSPNSTSPNRSLLRLVEKYVPIDKIKRNSRKFSNESANPINANYTELLLNGCEQLNRYVVPPNVFH